MSLNVVSNGEIVFFGTFAHVWTAQVEEDIAEECGKHGPVHDAKIERATAGFVYLKFGDVDSAGRCVSSMNNRWFAGKQIGVDYVSVDAFDAI